MELLYKKRFQAMKDTPKERAKDYLKDFLSKKYFDIDQIGVWTPIEVIEFAESFAKQEVERACKVPFKCPVCLGKGKLPHSFYITSGQGATSSISDVTCRTCNGATIIYAPQPKI